MILTQIGGADARELLRGAKTPEEKSARVLEQFEAILVREVLKAVPHCPVDGGKKSGGSKIMGEIYGDLANDVVAGQISRSGQLGLRTALSRQFALQMGASKPEHQPPRDP